MPLASGALIMSNGYPCGGLGRRQFLSAAAAIPAMAAVPVSYVSAQEPKAASGKAEDGHKGVI